MIKTTITLFFTAVDEVFEKYNLFYDEGKLIDDENTIVKSLVKDGTYYQINFPALQQLKISDSAKKEILEFIDSKQDSLDEYYDDFAIFLSVFST